VITRSEGNYNLFNDFNFISINFQEIEQNGLADRKDSDKPLVAAFTIDGKFPMNKEFRCLFDCEFLP